MKSNITPYSLPTTCFLWSDKVNAGIYSVYHQGGEMKQADGTWNVGKPMLGFIWKTMCHVMWRLVEYIILIQ